MSFRRGAAIAVLVLAGVSGCATSSAYRDIRPSCQAPAPLVGKFDPRAPDFSVELRPGVDVTSVVDDLAKRYEGFHPRNACPCGTSVAVATGEMTPETVAALRCDPAVARVSHDQVLKHLF
jgi:hypothetical protein